jgi:hypothetical protein
MKYPLPILIYFIVFGSVMGIFFICNIITLVKCIMDRPKKKDYTKLTKKEIDNIRRNEDF